MNRSTSIGSMALVVAVFGIAAQANGSPAPLIPREMLFQGSDKTAPKLSPDGKRMSYLGRTSGGVLNVFVRTIGQNDDRQITNDDRRGVTFYGWAADNEHMLFVQDRDGDENWHLYATHLETGETRDLTPFEGVRAGNILLDPKHPKQVLVGLNKRDPRVSDMHRVNIESGDVTLAARNPGDVVEWLTDSEFVIRAQAAIDNEARSIIRVRDSEDDEWRELFAWDFWDAPFDRYQRLIGFSPDGKELLVQTASGTNTTRIVAVHLESGSERLVIPAHGSFDIMNTFDLTLAYMPAVLLYDKETHAIQAYALFDLKPDWRVLDESMKEDFERLDAEFGAGNYAIIDRDAEDRRWMIAYQSDVHPGSHHVYDREAGTFDLLFEDKPHLNQFTFAKRTIASYEARDGRTIVAWLTIPVGVEPKNLPLIVLPHGGPWFRDYWFFSAEVQWLANRGYAVLQPQFRGSIGFGKAFLAASRGEFGDGHVQHDLTDGVKWAIKAGIADPERIGIMGGSYGGYATLAGLAFTPELYRCGVDIVGMANLKTSLEAFPPYWAPRLRRWINLMGNTLEDDELNRRISPVFHADKIQSPLLVGHGANDPRVKIDESNQIVEAMRKNDREVIYVVYPDEGHGFNRPANNEDFNGRVEEFLAKHLGGRKERWVKVEGTSAELR